MEIFKKPSELSSEVAEINKLSNEAIKEAIAQHHKAGRKVPVMRAGKILWI
jgi:hypothetical protein